MRSLWGLVALWGAGCADLPKLSVGETHGSSQGRAVQAVPVRSLEAPRYGCQNPPPALTRYNDIEQGRPFTLTLRKDEGGEWMPTPALSMPHHHASRIDWQSDSPLAPLRSQEVTVIATGGGRTSLVPRGGRWFASYAARIEQVCPGADRP